MPAATASSATASAPPAAPPQFRLNPDLDIPALAAAYKADGRVRVFDLLAGDAVDRLYEDLTTRKDWWHLMVTDSGVTELDRETRAAMTPAEHAELDARVQDRARLGFGYRYEGLRVEEDDDRPDDPLEAFARLMGSEPMLDMLRAVTGCTALSFTDGQATAYGPGDFLTGHDDNVIGKNRLAAYVFGITPRWRPEWGGLLLFHGPGDSTVAGNVPRYNVLDLFAVPQRHSVSQVSPAAPCPRYAVTGWLRAEGR